MLLERGIIIERERRACATQLLDSSQLIRTRNEREETLSRPKDNGCICDSYITRVSPGEISRARGMEDLLIPREVGLHSL